MPVNAANAKLEHISVDLIDKNPENPRLIFRQEEFDSLLSSIRQYGVQVPISVYRKGKRYTLIDGERRWKCCLKLNFSTIPALVQDEPDALTNLLLMFNIHALREQWDLLTIALKLPKIIQLLKKRHGREPTEPMLSQETGLSRGVIRRCKFLVELPNKFKTDLLSELEKPKTEQKLSEDLFIEMERSLKTVENYLPDVIGDKNEARDTLIEKYKTGVIGNITDFRHLAKIARAENVGVSEKVARRAVDRLLSEDKYSISTAFYDTVAHAYEERDIITRVDSLVTSLEELDIDDIDDELKVNLAKLYAAIERLLEDEI